MAVFWTGIILFFCLERASDIPQIEIPHIDKLVHAVFHFGFTSLWFLFFKKQWSDLTISKLLTISFVSSLLFGVAIEFMQQYFTISRNADVFDVFANMFGTLLAIISILFFNKFTGIVAKI